MPDIATKPQLLQTPSRRMRIVNPYKDMILDGLVGWWPMDEGSGSTAADASDQGNDGTLQNMEAGDWVTGWHGSGYALDFGGTDELVQVYDGRINDDTQGTICAWIKTGALSTNEVRNIFGYGGGATAKSFAGIFRYTYRDLSGTEKLQIVQGADDESASIVSVDNPNIDDSSWHCVAITSDGAAWKIYIDGVNQSLTVDSGTNHGDWLGDTTAETTGDKTYIGATRYKGTDYHHFIGTIDDVRLYNRALSAAEIAAIAEGHG